MMSQSLSPLSPIGVYNVAAGATSAFADFREIGDTVLVINSAPAVAYVTFGPPGTVATWSGIPIPPGGSSFLRIASYAKMTAAVILANGSGNVVFYVGKSA